MLGHRGCRLGVTFPEIYRHAGAGDHRGRLRASRDEGIEGAARDHDPARRRCAQELKLVTAARRRRGGRSRRASRAGVQGRVPDRHDDRAAARGAHRRRDRRGRRVLQLRHQRPDADDASASPATTSGRFLPDYLDAEHPRRATRSRRSTSDGVGELIEIARREGPGGARRTSRSASAASTAATRPSIEFCHKLGLDYVRCSPFRVPIARLAAAQAALRVSAQGGVEPTYRAARRRQGSAGARAGNDRDAPLVGADVWHLLDAAWTSPRARCRA